MRDRVGALSPVKREREREREREQATPRPLFVCPPPFSLTNKVKHCKLLESVEHFLFRTPIFIYNSTVRILVALFFFS